MPAANYTQRRLQVFTLSSAWVTRDLSFPESIHPEDLTTACNPFMEI
jgi:hypothetical protein